MPRWESHPERIAQEPTYVDTSVGRAALELCNSGFTAAFYAFLFALHPNAESVRPGVWNDLLGRAGDLTANPPVSPQRVLEYVEDCQTRVLAELEFVGRN